MRQNAYTETRRRQASSATKPISSGDEPQRTTSTPRGPDAQDTKLTQPASDGRGSERRPPWDGHVTLQLGELQMAGNAPCDLVGGAEPGRPRRPSISHALPDFASRHPMAILPRQWAAHCGEIHMVLARSEHRPDGHSTSDGSSGSVITERTRTPPGRNQWMLSLSAPSSQPAWW